MDSYRAASLDAWSSVAPDWAELSSRVDRQLKTAGDWMLEALALALALAPELWANLDSDTREAIEARIRDAAKPYEVAAGGIALPERILDASGRAL